LLGSPIAAETKAKPINTAVLPDDSSEPPVLMVVGIAGGTDRGLAPRCRHSGAGTAEPGQRSRDSGAGTAEPGQRSRDSTAAATQHPTAAEGHGVGPGVADLSRTGSDRAVAHPRLQSRIDDDRAHVCPTAHPGVELQASLFDVRSQEPDVFRVAGEVSPSAIVMRYCHP